VACELQQVALLALSFSLVASHTLAFAWEQVVAQFHVEISEGTSKCPG
jgi:hypothetical protein